MLLPIACSDQQTGRYTPEALRIGLLPDESPQSLKKRFTPLGLYLSEHTGLPYELIIPADYKELVDEFSLGNIDLAYFGGLTFLQARSRAQAIPLVMRDIDAYFTSYFFVKADSPLKSLKDLRGLRLSFGSPLSTSGHLMPRFFFSKQNIEVETFFNEVLFSGAHDATAEFVLNGKADIGVANSEIIDAMLGDGRLNSDKIRIIWETPTYADYVWVAQSNLDQSVRDQLTSAFLDLSPVDQGQSELLGSLGAGGYLPARMSDFENLMDIATSLGLLQVDQ